MEEEVKNEIEKISKEFASGFKPEIDEIAGSGWLIVDPLSGFLNASGFENELKKLPPTDTQPLVLVMIFKDGTQFIPAGSDLNIQGTTDWLWL